MALAKVTAASEVIGLRRRMSSLQSPNSAPNSVHSDHEDARLSDSRKSDKGLSNPNGGIVHQGDEESSASDSISHSYSSCGSSGSNASEEPPIQHAGHDIPEVQRREDTGESSETLTPRSRKAKGRVPYKLAAARRGDKEDSPESSTWFSYDLSIVVALVSPLGNWLTGGDHVKNLLLILLFIFYLHQLIEVPWKLYKSSNPSYRPNREKAPAYIRVAASELRTLELFYLTLTVISPFLGATLLRHISVAISGSKQSLSWFNTLLFVLATGIRPWSHLVERLQGRSRSLNQLLRKNALEEAEADARAAEIDVLTNSIADLKDQVQRIERRLSRYHTKNKDGAKDIHEQVSHAIEGMEKSVRHSEKHMSKSLSTHDTRIAVLESHLNSIRVAVERFDPRHRALESHKPLPPLWGWLSWLFRTPQAKLYELYHPSNSRPRHLTLDLPKPLLSPSLKRNSSSDSASNKRLSPRSTLLAPIPEEGSSASVPNSSPTVQNSPRVRAKDHRERERDKFREKDRDLDRPPPSPSFTSYHQIHLFNATPTAAIQSPVQNIAAFALSPFTLCLRLTMATIKLPKTILRYVLG